MLDGRVCYNESTLLKVYDALRDSGLSSQQIIDTVNQMLNKGILFRERI